MGKQQKWERRYHFWATMRKGLIWIVFNSHYTFDSDSTNTVLFLWCLSKENIEACPMPAISQRIVIFDRISCLRRSLFYHWLRQGPSSARPTARFISIHFRILLKADSVLFCPLLSDFEIFPPCQPTSDWSDGMVLCSAGFSRETTRIVGPADDTVKQKQIRIQAVGVRGR